MTQLTDGQKKAFAILIAMEPRFKIAYFFPHKNQDLTQASRFGWYTPGVHDAAKPLILAATLPADLREPYTDSASVLRLRLVRKIWPLILPIEIGALAEARTMLGTPLQVIISTDAGVADTVDEMALAASPPVLHVSTVAGQSRTMLSMLDANCVSNYSRKVIDHLAQTPAWAEAVRVARQSISSSPRRRSRKHVLPGGLHNVVEPNERALIAFGWKLRPPMRISETLTPGGGDAQKYVHRICKSVDAVSAARRDLLRDVHPDIVDYRYVLAVPSVYWANFSTWRGEVQNSDPAMRLAKKRALSTIIRRKSYFDQLKVEHEYPHPDDELYVSLAREYAKDMHCFTAGLTLLSCATLAPVIRMEPKLNELRGEMSLLAHCVRSDATPNFSWKTSRLVRKLGDRMRSLVAADFLARIDAISESGRIEGMKIVSDLPIELLPTRGLSLGLRFDASRIAPVPGNMFLEACAMQPILVSLRKFDQVLVIRSFAENDILLDMFESAVLRVAQLEDSSPVQYRFVDVNTADEFVEALLGYDGAVLVFDGHGTFDPITGTGALVVGGKPLDTWSLRGRCHFPPIVMLSACDTQPIDGSHSSVATAAFVLGAHTVLGTLMPIYGDSAAVFNARMLFRIRSFIPVALADRPLRSGSVS